MWGTFFRLAEVGRVRGNWLRNDKRAIDAAQTNPYFPDARARGIARGRCQKAEDATFLGAGILSGTLTL